MQQVSSAAITVAQHLESMGVDIARDGFASWVRDELGFQMDNEHVERALRHVQDMVASGHARTIADVTHTIAAAVPARSHIDAFGGSAWTID